MKAVIGTSLSLVGVVVAGSAAAMVNAQVLRSADSATSVPPLAPSAPAVTVAATTTTVASTEVVYRVGECGVVTVDAAGGALSLVSVVPNPGWQVEVSPATTPGVLQVRFAAWGLDVTMTATLVDGVVVPSVSSGVVEQVDSDGAAGGAATATTAVPPTAPALPPPTVPVVPSTAHVEHHEDEHEHEDERDDGHEDGHDDDD